MGSLDYTPEERRQLAARSRAEVPQFGNADRQSLTQAVHDRMLGRWAEIQARRRTETKHNEGPGGDGTNGLCEGEGGSSASTTAAEGAAAGGAGEEEEEASTSNPWAAVTAAPNAPTPNALTPNAPTPNAPTPIPTAAPVPVSVSPPPPSPPATGAAAVQPPPQHLPASTPAYTPPRAVQTAAPTAPAPAPTPTPAPAPAPSPTPAPALAHAPPPPGRVAAVGRPAVAGTTDSPAVASLKFKLDFLALLLTVGIISILLRKFLVSQRNGEL